MPLSDTAKTEAPEEEELSFHVLNVANTQSEASSRPEALTSTEQDLNWGMDEKISVVNPAGSNQPVAAEKATFSRSAVQISFIRKSFEVVSSLRRFSFTMGPVVAVITALACREYSERQFAKFHRLSILKGNALIDHRQVATTRNRLGVCESNTFGGQGIRKCLIDAVSSLLAKTRTPLVRKWLRDVGEYLGEPLKGGSTFSEQPRIFIAGRDGLESSKDRPEESRTNAPCRASAKCLPRIQSLLSHLLLVLLIPGGVDAATYYNHVLEEATSSSPAFMMGAIMGALSILSTASMVAITEDSLRKRVRRGQSTWLTCVLFALTMVILPFALTDDALGANERFLFAMFLAAFGIWVLGSLLRTILRRQQTCSDCNGVGCDTCGGGSSSGEP